MRRTMDDDRDGLGTPFPPAYLGEGDDTKAVAQALNCANNTELE